MRFCDVSEVPQKPVFTRLFDLFATDVLANFQDRLVMTTSISLRIFNFKRFNIIPREFWIVNTKYKKIDRQ